MRTLLLSLLTLASLLPALDTPLVVQSADGDTTAVISPTNGTIQIYEISGETLVRRATTNFLSDLALLEAAYVTLEQPNMTLLRTGAEDKWNTPTYGTMIDKVFTELDRAQSRKDEREPFSQRVLNSEAAYWSQDIKYDGKVAAAMGSNGLFLVIPSSYTILAYWLDGWEMRLTAHRNYRTELYVPSVWKSYPTPQEILEKLPKDISENHKKALEEREQAAGALAQNQISIAPSEVWATVVDRGSADVFFLFDTANQRLITYTLRGVAGGARLEVKSVRNIEYDLLIPAFWNSTPDMSVIVDQYNRELKKARLSTVSEGYLRKLADVRAIQSSDTNDIQASTDDDARLFLDFPKRRKLLLYDPFGKGDQLRMLSARDYTLEIGIGVHQREMQQRRHGITIYNNLQKVAHKDRLVQSFAMMSTILNWNPWLYREMEKDTKLKRAGMDNHPDWQVLLDKAIQEVDRLEAEQAAIEAALAAEEEQRRKR